MYFSASALAGFEIIILLTLQIIIGNMYQLSGMVIAGLMAGLAIGSGAEIRILNSASKTIIAMSLLLVYAAIGSIYNYMILLKSEIPALGHDYNLILFTCRVNRPALSYTYSEQ